MTGKKVAKGGGMNWKLVIVFLVALFVGMPIADIWAEILHDALHMSPYIIP